MTPRKQGEEREHTPWTWKWEEMVDAQGNAVIGLGDDGACGDPDCCGPPGYHIEVTPEHKAFIVRACNAFDPLVEALTEAREVFGRPDLKLPVEIAAIELIERALTNALAHAEKP